jgi:hypothetical protein
MDIVEWNVTRIESDRPPERGRSQGYWSEVIMELMREQDLSEKLAEEIAFNATTK